MLTYKQARIDHLQTLKVMGWTLSDTDLKVPYATSPDGTCRLWFKAQALHFTSVTRFSKHEFKRARAVSQFGLDIRAVSTYGILQAVAYLP